MKNNQFECVEPDEQEYAEYSAHFAAYNKERSGGAVETFSIVLRDNGKIVAGGRGRIYLGALEIRGLWVDEAVRGNGTGSRLLATIESEARRRNATKAMLFTYSWQAENFYARHGYSTYAKFEFPDGHYRVDMQKDI